jgi:aspartyl/asparaginyl beta-hydroxylase (cupin superfamily)
MIYMACIFLLVIVVVGVIILTLFFYDPYIPVAFWNSWITGHTGECIPDDVLRELYNSQDVIRYEFLSAIGKIKDTKVSDINEYERTLNNDGTWRMIYLKLFNEWRSDGHFPRTIGLLKNSKHRIGTATISCLYPGTVIPRHHGPYEGVLRCHIPLFIPEGDVGLRVYLPGQKEGPDSVVYDWKTPFYFKDTLDHEAWNKTSGYRIVLIFDIILDLPTPLKQINDIFLAACTEHALWSMREIV